MTKGAQTDARRTVVCEATKENALIIITTATAWYLRTIMENDDQLTGAVRFS